MEESVGLLVFLGLAAFCAGFVDSVVGGGGLIQLPALFGSHAGASTASLHGTNKFSSIAGTGWSAWRYLRVVRLDWRVAGPAVLMAAPFAWLGANAVSLLPRAWAQPLVLVLLVLVAIFTFQRKEMGLVHAPRLSARMSWVVGGLTGGVIGFYDGFFGPGTGAFLIFVFVRFFGYDFLHASANSKLVNATTNVAALLFFLPTGAILWATAVVMAVGNIVGATLGTRLAFLKGSGFVRQFFLILLVGMIVRMGWTTWEMF